MLYKNDCEHQEILRLDIKKVLIFSLYSYQNHLLFLMIYDMHETKIFPIWGKQNVGLFYYNVKP